MSDIIIIGNKLPPFSWLPNHLVNDPNVSAEALAVALYLNGKPVGWQARPADIRKRFGWGRHTWLKVSKELKALGLLNEIKHVEGTSLVFELPEMQMSTPQLAPSENRTVRKPTVGFSDPLDHKDHNKKDYLNNHKDHMSDEVDKEKRTEDRTRKPTMKQRETYLTSDGLYMYEKLLAYRGIFAGVAMAIVEQHMVGDINNLLEIATRDGVKNPGAYVVKSLYNKKLG